MSGVHYGKIDREAGSAVAGTLHGRYYHLTMRTAAGAFVTGITDLGVRLFRQPRLSAGSPDVPASVLAVSAGVGQGGRPNPVEIDATNHPGTYRVRFLETDSNFTGALEIRATASTGSPGAPEPLVLQVDVESVGGEA